MRSKRDHVACLAVIGALSAVPTMASSQLLPAGGNPFQVLADQVTDLSRRVQDLEHPKPPLRLSGLYWVTTSGYCVETTGTGSLQLQPRPGTTTIVWAVQGTGKVRTYTETINERWYSDGNILNVSNSPRSWIVSQDASPSDMPAAIFVEGNPPGCTSSYEMGSAPDGTFVKKMNCNEAGFVGTVILQGRAFQGGRTLGLLSTKDNMLMHPVSKRQRMCAVTQTAYKVAD